jgi:TonB family protein
MVISRSVLAAAAVMFVVPTLAKSQEAKAARETLNWDILQKLYPRRALLAREEGAVGFTVTLDNKGEVTGCQVTHSSGHPLLDEETCKIITMNAQFKPDFNLGPSQIRTHEGMIAWKLPATEATAVLAPPQPMSVPDAPEKIVCKKTVRAGTLAGFERTCMTPTEWAKQSDRQKEPWADVQGKKGSTSGAPCFNPNGC